ncbi:hypothetical protein OS493_038357, partial [Desmophyllum pertusum]
MDPPITKLLVTQNSKLTKLRATSNLVIQETKGTISSISRFLDLLKAIDAQDIVKATQLLVNSIDLVKERNRTIRIADSSDGGGLQLNITRIHVLNAVTLDLDDDKRFRAAEREAISDRNRTRARCSQNAERLQNRLTSYPQPYGARGQFQRGQFQRGQFTTSTAPRQQQQQQQPDFHNRARGACRFLRFIRALVDRVSCQARSHFPLPRQRRPRGWSKYQYIYLPTLICHLRSFWIPCLRMFSELLSTCQKSQPTSKQFGVPQNDLSQEFSTLLTME